MLYKPLISSQPHENENPTAEFKAKIGTSRSNNCLETGICYGTPLKRVSRKFSKSYEEEREEHVCTKNYSKTKALTGALFVVRCAKHRYCVGFHIVKDKESVKDPFNVIYCFWEKAPKMIIYDNGCHLP